jgi:hypothetical protein
MTKFGQEYRKTRITAIKVVVNNLDRATVGLFSIVSQVYSKLKVVYNSYPIFWEALISTSNSSTMSRDDL